MKIYVGNLSPVTSRSELLECFEEFGKVTDATIGSYRMENTSKGFGQVEMPSSYQGRAAIAAMQGSELDGNLLKVHED